MMAPFAAVERAILSPFTNRYSLRVEHPASEPSYVSIHQWSLPLTTAFLLALTVSGEHEAGAPAGPTPIPSPVSKPAASDHGQL